MGVIGEVVVDVEVVGMLDVVRISDDAGDDLAGELDGVLVLELIESEGVGVLTGRI